MVRIAVPAPQVARVLATCADTAAGKSAARAVLCPPVMAAVRWLLALVAAWSTAVNVTNSKSAALFQTAPAAQAPATQAPPGPQPIRLYG
jgi:hypothetical protein